MIGSDLTPFFQAGEFAVAASWTPSGGGSTRSDNVIFDSADVDVLSGRQSSTEYKITFPGVSPLASIDEDEVVTISGVAYTVREVGKVDDGNLVIATLEAL